MGIFSGLSGMIETVRVKAAPHDALSSSRKLIPLENVVWRSPDLSFAAMDSLPRHRQNGDNVGNLPDIIDLSEVVMNPSAVPSKEHWQNADRSIRLENPPKHRHRRNNHRSQCQAVKPANQAKISHLRNHMMTLNPAFASGFMPELITGLTRIWLIWLKMRCKPPHKVVQNLSINRNKRVIRL